MIKDEGEEVSAVGRIVLTGDDQLLFRQILLPLRDGRATWEVFKGRKGDRWQVSVDRQSKCPTAEDSYARYTTHGANSYGTLATSVGDLREHRVRTYEEPVADNAAHCEYDLERLGDGTVVSNGRREKICVSLLEHALNGDTCAPYVPT